MPLLCWQWVLSAIIHKRTPSLRVWGKNVPIKESEALACTAAKQGPNQCILESESAFIYFSPHWSSLEFFGYDADKTIPLLGSIIKQIRVKRNQWQFIVSLKIILVKYRKEGHGGEAWDRIKCAVPKIGVLMNLGCQHCSRESRNENSFNWQS